MNLPISYKTLGKGFNFLVALIFLSSSLVGSIHMTRDQEMEWKTSGVDESGQFRQGAEPIAPIRPALATTRPTSDSRISEAILFDLEEYWDLFFTRSPVQASLGKFPSGSGRRRILSPQPTVRNPEFYLHHRALRI